MYPEPFALGPALQRQVEAALDTVRARFTPLRSDAPSSYRVTITARELGGNVLARATPTFIVYDVSTDWSTFDIGSVTLHESAHVLGVGTSARWDDLVVGGAFVGPVTAASRGSPVRVSPDGDHPDLSPAEALLSVTVLPGRRGWLETDLTILRDIGYAYAPDAILDPFPGFSGPVLSRTGDATGDGVPDSVFAPTVGSSHVKVFSGATGNLARSFLAYPGYLGAIDLAAACGRVTTVARDGSGAHLKVFDRGSEEIVSRLLFPGYLGPVEVQASDRLRVRASNGHRIDVSPLTGEVLTSEIA